MYSIKTDLYQCDFCGFEEKWDAEDKMWKYILHKMLQR